ASGRAHRPGLLPRHGRERPDPAGRPAHHLVGGGSLHARRRSGARPGRRDRQGDGNAREGRGADPRPGGAAMIRRSRLTPGAHGGRRAGALGARGLAAAPLVGTGNAAALAAPTIDVHVSVKIILSPGGAAPPIDDAGTIPLTPALVNDMIAHANTMF